MSLTVKMVEDGLNFSNISHQPRILLRWEFKAIASPCLTYKLVLKNIENYENAISL